MSARLFIKEDFREPFTTKDFIERLTQKYVARARSSQTAFDPKPLVELIETSIADLIRLDKDVEGKVGQLEQEIMKVEEQHRDNLTGLTGSLELAVTSFEKLEERIKNVATKAVHIGDQLETMNLKRQRAAQARELMDYFSQFNTPGQQPSRLFDDPKMIHVAANVLQKLNFMAAELTEPMYDRAKERIKAKCDEVEQSLLMKFSESYTQGDLAVMKECANTLYYFKGFTQCVDLFINQHPFFYDVSKVNHDPNADLCEEIVEVCRSESKLMMDVFYSPKTVMHRFLERIFEQRLQDHIDDQLEAARARSVQHYLERLHALYKRCHQLRTQLLELELCNDAALLNKLTENLFCLHLPDNIYINNEVNAMRGNYEEQLEGFYESLGHEKKDPTQAGLLDRFDAVFDNIMQSDENNEISEKLLNAELALTFIYDNKNAVSRCMEISAPDRVAESVEKIFSLLLDYLVEQHMDYALDFGLGCVPPPDSRREPQLRSFPLVYRTNYIFHVLQNYYSTTVLQAMSSSFAIQTRLSDRKNELMQRLQSKSNKMLRKTTAAIVGWTDRLLETEQTRRDFCPPDDGDITIFSMPHSNACGSVVAFLRKQQEAISKSLDGENREAFVVELCICLQQCLLNHVRRFTISSTGALLLSRDINTYVSVVKDFEVPAATQVFNVIKDLCNVFMVRPDNIKQIIADSCLHRMDRNMLLALLERRVDWRQCRKAVLASLGMG